MQKDGDSFSLIWGGLAIRREGDLAVHRQQYFVYMIFDEQLVQILHLLKFMHNQDCLVAASDIGRAIIKKKRMLHRLQ